MVARFLLQTFGPLKCAALLGFMVFVSGLVGNALADLFLPLYAPHGVPSLEEELFLKAWTAIGMGVFGVIFATLYFFARLHLRDDVPARHTDV